MSATTEEAVVEVLKAIYDPEIPVNIYDLGLIYEVDVEGSEVSVVMSLTSPSCPAAQEIPANVETKVLEKLEGVEKCRVHIVWEPAWTPQRISAEGKKILGLDTGEKSDDDDSTDDTSSS